MNIKKRVLTFKIIKIEKRFGTTNPLTETMPHKHRCAFLYFCDCTTSPAEIEIRMGILKKKTDQKMHTNCDKHNLSGNALVEKQHEMFLYQMFGFSVCMVTMRKPFARSTVLVCTDSWHGFPRVFFCADFLRGC